MAELTIDKTYGEALYKAAKELDKVELIKKESLWLSELLEKEEDLALFIKTPTISAMEKKQALEKILRGNICDELLNLMFILCDKGRTGRYGKIIKAFNEFIDSEAGFTTGVVYSVVPLEASKLEKLEEEVGRLLNQKLRLRNEIDKSLIGGLKIYADGKLIDASIKTRLKSLESVFN